MKILTGGDLIDGSGRDPITNATVVIDDEGRIVQVGKLSGIPPGAEVIDVSGRTIMPGLIDCHVHFFVDLKPLHDLAATPMSLRMFEAAANAKSTLDSGVTSVRDACGTPRGFKTALERGLIPGPRMKISITPVSQTGGHGDMLMPSGIYHPLLPSGLPGKDPAEWPNGVADGVDEVRKSVRAILKAGADVIKLMASGGVLSPGTEPTSTQFTREEIAAIVQEAKAQGKATMAHAQSAEGIRNAVESGVGSIEHGIFVDEVTMAEMKRRGTFLVPTLQAIRAAIRRGESSPGSVLPESMRKARATAQVQVENIRQAVRFGVPVAMGTDAGVGEHGRNAEELGLLVEAGMSPMQAIVAATRTAAECARFTDAGTLEPGKRADLLVVDGNPLNDLRVMEDKSKLLMIMQGGRAHKNAIQ